MKSTNKYLDAIAMVNFDSIYRKLVQYSEEKKWSGVVRKTEIKNCFVNHILYVYYVFFYNKNCYSYFSKTIYE